MHELVHIYGAAPGHEDRFMSLMNSSGVDVYSCGLIGTSQVIAKLDADSAGFLNQAFGERPDEDVPDFGMSNVIQTLPSIDLFGVGKTVLDTNRTVLRPNASATAISVRFSVFNPRNRTFGAELHYFWVPNPTPGRISGDRRASDSGAVEALEVTSVQMAPFATTSVMVDVSTPTPSVLVRGVDYHLVVEVRPTSGVDGDLADNNLMLPVVLVVESF